MSVLIITFLVPFVGFLLTLDARIWTLIRSQPSVDRFYLSRKLATPFQSAPVPPLHYTQHPKLYRDISRELDIYSLGVAVLFGPTGSGKTTTVLEVAKEKQLAGRTGVIMNPPLIPPNSTIEWFRQSLDLWSKEEISDLLPSGNRTFIIIDQFETFKDLRDTKRFVTINALHSSNIGKFSMFLIVSDFKFYSEILTWNGGDKIRGLPGDYRWDEALLAKLVDSSEQSQALVALCAKTKLPTCIRYFHGQNLNDLTEDDQKKLEEMEGRWKIKYPT